MTQLEYRTTIIDGIKTVSQNDDNISVVRDMLDKCFVNFPYGDYNGILEQLSSNNFTLWRSCTYEEAFDFVNAGTPTVGIGSGTIIVIIPNGDEKVESVYAKAIGTLTTDEIQSLNFFSYSAPFSETMINMGSTSNTAKTSLSDGFDKWYYQSCWTTGVRGKVPRFAQNASGPCLAYAIMSGCYNLYHSTENVNTFFNNRVANGYINSSGSALWRTFTDIQNYSLDDMKCELEVAKPVVVSGNSGTTDHFVLVVAYSGNGTTDSDFIVIDSWHSTPVPTTLAAFKASYPYDTSKFGDYTYPMFTFK